MPREWNKCNYWNYANGERANTKPTQDERPHGDAARQPRRASDKRVVVPSVEAGRPAGQERTGAEKKDAATSPALLSGQKKERRGERQPSTLSFRKMHSAEVSEETKHSETPLRQRRTILSRNFRGEKERGGRGRETENLPMCWRMNTGRSTFSILVN
ncbi:unnamed protein product [Bursaphelenchus xylophilus]|uniref:(pine wood nematode) hypothetical protein n=1 Tax=Bursaphelenchus xylophilus TaxID=6326 RepID=A0A1I7SA76_BURXY|nr:unnamed protein product [Bursaphelenchus xylophilus]CAG9084210.1 unnamed protein product [Bursaphelenchus xylophilus]